VDQHIKKNLVIFVTARLVNPEGAPITSDEEKEESVEPLPLPEIAPREMGGKTYRPLEQVRYEAPRVESRGVLNPAARTREKNDTQHLPRQMQGGDSIPNEISVPRR
jgi:hypothetical protein